MRRAVTGVRSAKPINGPLARLKFNLQGFGYFQFGVFDANRNYLKMAQSALPVQGATSFLRMA